MITGDPWEDTPIKLDQILAEKGFLHVHWMDDYLIYGWKKHVENGMIYVYMAQHKTEDGWNFQVYGPARSDPIDPSGNVRSWSAMPKEIVDFVLAVKDVVHKWHKGKIDDLETGLAHLKAMGEHYPGPKWGVCGCGKDLYRFSSGPRSGAVHAPEDEMHHADFYRELQEHGEIHLDE